MLLLMFGYVHVMYFRLPSRVLPSSFCLAIGQHVCQRDRALFEHVCQRDRALFDWQAAKEFLNRGSAKRNVVYLPHRPHPNMGSVVCGRDGVANPIP